MGKLVLLKIVNCELIKTFQRRPYNEKLEKNLFFPPFS